MLKKLILTSLVALLVLPVFFQVQSVSAKQHPVTSPVTSPVTFFNLVGKVTYKQLGKWMHNKFKPAGDAMVHVKGFFDNKKYSTKTTDQGQYQMMLPDGLYTVSVKDSKNTFFTPPLRVVKVSSTGRSASGGKSQKVQHADFQGLLFW